jgi:predicted nuclease of predicted toxin-antitoxin system
MPRLKLLLDENIGRLVASSLGQSKFDVISMLEVSSGSSDEAILALAHREKRIIVTLDKDFGTLVHLHFRKHAGVILLRLEDESPKAIYKILSLVLKQPAKKLKGKFIVATETKMRVR